MKLLCRDVRLIIGIANIVYRSHPLSGWLFVLAEKTYKKYKINLFITGHNKY